jgi:transglutaminase-like putative cysteine protease
MWLHASTLLEFHVPVAAPFLLMLRPRSGMQQWVAREQYVVLPNVPTMEFTDPFGNLCQRLVAPEGRFSIHTSVDIEAADECDRDPGAPFIEVQDLPEGSLPFLLPSRYCESDRFAPLASSIVMGHRPGYDQCEAIVAHIRERIAYRPERGEQIVSAWEALQQGYGVCRDLAHIGISCCRALAIPARLVVGYLETLKPMDLHAWFEAYVGHRWYTFDPTQQDLVGGRIALAYGRDAADVAIYTQFGVPVALLNMNVSVERLAGPPM